MATPEPPEPAAAAAPRRARLTLQERLAQAARAKKKAPSRDESTTPQPAPQHETGEGDTAPEIAESGNDSVPKDPEIAPETPEPPLHEPVPASDSPITSLQAENADLAAKNTQLAAQNAQLAAQVRELQRRAESLEKSAKSAQLGKSADKDRIIAELREEGAALSRKEVALTEKTRTLAQENARLEQALKGYATKNEEALLKLSEVDDIVKSYKLSSVDQLFEKLQEAQNRASAAEAQLEKEVKSNWESRYREAQQLFENELDERKKTTKAVTALELQLELHAEKLRLELQGKDALVEQLSGEIATLKLENSAEVARLEAKVEDLRVYTEHGAGAASTAVAESHAGLSSSDSSPHVDYAEYSRLLEAHRNLQAQYVSLQENWKLIESTLQGKVDTLTLALETGKRSKAKQQTELRRAAQQLAGAEEELAKARESLAEARAGENDARFLLQLKTQEYVELEDRLEELRAVFSTDRANLDAKIVSLSEQVRTLESQAPLVDHNGSFLSMDSLRRPREPLLLQLRSYLFQSLLQHLASWEDSPDLVPPSLSFLQSEEPASFFEDRDETVASVAGGGSFAGGSGATKHIQIINKMSASIRRLDMEIANLKEENEELSSERAAFQQDKLKVYELEKAEKELRDQLAQLATEIDLQKKKEETLLQLVGEKSELVEELRADIVDLKEICRQQVQQMIEAVETKKSSGEK